MSNIKEQIQIGFSDVGYNTGITWDENIKMSKDAWIMKMVFEIGGTIIAVLLLFTAIVMIIQLTSKLNNTLMFGTRTQKMCGQSYMEFESARNKLYIEYTSPGTTKKIKSIKQLLSASLIVITIVLGISLFISLIGYKIINMNQTEKIWGWRISGNGKFGWYLGFADIFLIIFLISFFAVNRKAVLENTYGVSKTEKSMTPLLIMMLILIVLICIMNIVVINPKLNDKTPTLFVLMIAAILTITFMFVINIRTKKIADDFTSNYAKYSNDINLSICNLGQDDKNTIQEGINKNMKIKKWVKQLLSRNYKRIFQDEEDGDIDIEFGNNIDNCTNEKFKMNYVYLEHSHGKELDELPDNVDHIHKDRNTIRKNMWNMRNENDKMIKPIKQFVQQMRIFILIVLFMITFMVYHIAYINYPGYTKLVLVSVVLIFTFVLMYSVIV